MPREKDASKLEASSWYQQIARRAERVLECGNLAVVEFMRRGLGDLLARQQRAASAWRQGNASVVALHRARAQERRTAARPEKITSLVGQPLEVVHFLLEGVCRRGQRQAERNRHHVATYRRRHADRRREAVRVRQAERREEGRVYPETWPARVWVWAADEIVRQEEERAQKAKARRSARLESLTEAQRLELQARVRARRKAYRAAKPHVKKRERRSWRVNRRARRLPEDRIQSSLRRRVSEVLRATGAQKAARTNELVGTSPEFLRAYLEARFKPGMGWENYGEWHIDHIRPCASFNLLDPKQQRECFHFTNLQPLWAKENIAKGATWKAA